MEQNNYIGSLFEDDYLYRSLGSIVTQPDVALTELVANAWDAGATEVNISIPEQKDDYIVIEDNGTGMTKDEFEQRWMKLSYNREKFQGHKVEFPEGITGNRFAYGKNGIGRHGLLCFNQEYFLSTAKNGHCFECEISTQIKGEPIAALHPRETTCSFSSHGTSLRVKVIQNLPDIDKIKNIIASRFLHDPRFKIVINNETLPLDDLEGLMDHTVIPIEEYGITLNAWFVDTKKASRKSIYQGIAFWQDNRLVGEPSWLLGNELILDGRTTMGKQYTVIVSTNDLSEYVKPDWSGFKKSEIIDKVYIKITEYVYDKIREISIGSIESTKKLVKQEFKEKLKKVSPFVWYEVNEAIEDIHHNNPTVRQDAIFVAVDAIINLEKSKGGIELLEKLSKLEESDINGLNQLLSKWTVKDALLVLNEIDRRLSIIEAIRKLSNDPTTDELHVLHPLITEARWLFGPEFDSSEYTFNRQLQTIIPKILGKKIIQNEDINYKKRPDLVCLEDSTISTTGTETFDESNLPTVSKILLIELKKGGFKINRGERDQAVGYVESLLSHFQTCQIVAYVVGKDVDTTLQPSKVGYNDAGKIYAISYARLVSGAERRLFGLRNKLGSMYDEIPGMELFKQIKMDFGE
jgi:hypothetical protein